MYRTVLGQPDFLHRALEHQPNPMGIHAILRIVEDLRAWHSAVPSQRRLYHFFPFFPLPPFSTAAINSSIPLFFPSSFAFALTSLVCPLIRSIKLSSCSSLASPSPVIPPSSSSAPSTSHPRPNLFLKALNLPASSCSTFLRLSRLGCHIG